MQRLTETDLFLYAPPEGLSPSLLQQAEQETQRLLHTPLNFQGREYVKGLVIDPQGCLERDDAIWIDQTSDGWWIVDVSIADVAEHIRPGQALDHIANLKGFTRYGEDEQHHVRIVDRMFPPALSEDFLSLRQGQHRLTMTVSMLISPDMKVEMTDIHPTYLVSPRDFTYKDAADSRNDPSSDFYKTLLLADRFSRRLHRHTDSEEIGRNRVGENRMHVIVGDFMLLANCAIAQFAKQHGIPILYRNFQKRDGEGVTWGYYSIDADGHDGVDGIYAHGTSPIRRAPDIQVMRMIKRYRDNLPISDRDTSHCARVGRRANVAAHASHQFPAL